MAVFRPIDKGESANKPKPVFKSRHEEDQYYYNMVNPQNGMRYDIPMLNILDPEYYYKYINFMKMRERSEETFNKMLNWD
ncbi:MAG: hypothetical protein Q9N62_09345 [Ghiorsea sp.]|nr:hypothetical protein [Ghiorsea sp.]